MSVSLRLLEFPHSPFCEKARWALDYKSIAYDRVAVLPGFHLRTVRRYAPQTSLPLLLTGDSAVQGSAEIIDYLDDRYPGDPLTPAAVSARQKSLELEEAFGRTLGEPLRRIFYHRLLDYPGFIRSCFTHSLPPFKRLAFRLSYPMVRSRIYAAYVTSDAAALAAREEFRNAIDALADRLAGQPFLVGESFTRADLTAASMLAFVAAPQEHPFACPAIPDPDIRAFVASFTDHPACQWTRALYAGQRRARFARSAAGPG